MSLEEKIDKLTNAIVTLSNTLDVSIDIEEKKLKQMTAANIKMGAKIDDLAEKKSKVVKEDEDEEDDAPAKKKKVVDEDEEDEAPKKKKSRDEDEDEDEAPAKKKKVADEDEEEEEDEAPKKKKAKSEDDSSSDKKAKKSKSGKSEISDKEMREMFSDFVNEKPEREDDESAKAYDKRVDEQANERTDFMQEILDHLNVSTAPKIAQKDRAKVKFWLARSASGKSVNFEKHLPEEE